jgi:hypothetical protein
LTVTVLADRLFVTRRPEGLTVIEETLSPAGRPVASSVTVSWPEGTVNGLLHWPPTTDTVLSEPLTLNWKVEPVMLLAADLQISRIPQVGVVGVAALALRPAAIGTPTNAAVSSPATKAPHRVPRRRPSFGPNNLNISPLPYLAV